MKPHLFAISAGALVLTACSVGPDYQRPDTATPMAYEGGPWQPAQPRDDSQKGKWWEVYHDPKLNALEEQVNISNQNVLYAEAQFREAAAATKVARAGLFPTISASPSFTEAQAANTRGGSSRGGSSTGTVAGGGAGGGGATVISSDSSSRGSSPVTQAYNLPLQATYLVDIWGSVRRDIEANSAAAQASFADLENARLLYQSTLAQDYFNLRGLDAEKKLLEDTVASYEKFVTLTTNRYNAGIASKGDVAQAQTQLDSARAQLIELGVDRAQYEDAIATLIGQPAPNFSLGNLPLDELPPAIPPGVPSTLLERRPDISAAERNVASANAQIGVQVAAYFPQLTLTGEAGLQAIEFSQLFTGPAFFWSVGPTIAQTIFNGGKTHGMVQEAQANYEGTVDTYRQTTLTAFQQVQDDLSGLRILQEENDVADNAVKEAAQSSTIISNQYKAGTEDYLNVITTQALQLNDQITAVNLRTRRMVTSVLLVVALGGGWNTYQLPGYHGVADVPPAQAQIEKQK